MGVKKRRTPTPKQPTTSAVGATPPVGPGVEFRNLEDDAWYNIQLLLLNENLLVKFIEFPDDHDLDFHTADFSSAAEVSDFRRRFRPLTMQLEASDCSTVKIGMRVCALMSSAICRDDRRFYDAIVEAVKREEHTIVDGKENCLCTVILSWLHGPKAGTLTPARVEDLCPILPHKQLDPRVACFLELAKWKHGIASPCSKSISEDKTCKEESPTSLSCRLQNVILESEFERQMGSTVPYDEGNIGYEKDEDVDLGGGGGGGVVVDHVYAEDMLNWEKLVADVCDVDLGSRDHVKTKVAVTEARYFIVVENLEKDVSRSTIVDFVLEATGLEIEAFVFLSLSTEPYTRGALVVDCVEDLEKLCNFLVKPEQMITSLKGRPWIVSDSSATESVRPSFWCLEPDEKDKRRQSAGDELRIVQSGSEEYSKAVKLRDLYFSFTNHQQLLYKRLAAEEQSILDA